MVLDLNDPVELTGESSIRTVNTEDTTERMSGREEEEYTEEMEGDDHVDHGDKEGQQESEGCGFSPEEQAERIADKLAPGCTVESLDQAYVLYCEYARLIGFSVKKGTQGYFRKTADIRMKMFHCSCEGHPDNKAELYRLACYKKQVTRTDCKARLRVVRERDGPWTISVFHDEHNHELLGEEVSYMLRSARNMTHAKKSILESLNAAGIGVSKSFRWMEREAGGPSNVGFTRKDAYNHMNEVKRTSRVGNGDAQEVMKYFRAKSNAEPYFFWEVLPDSEGRMMNFFFRDCRCADDYESFGDVLSVDTTFRTNKYNLICAPFVGINHHRQNVMFGVAFISDESTKSFEWLFKVFLQSMSGKEPQSHLFRPGPGPNEWDRLQLQDCKSPSLPLAH